jgi:hypothetical protein
MFKHLIHLHCHFILKVQKGLMAGLYFFALLGSTHIKAALKKLVKLTLDENLIEQTGKYLSEMYEKI